MKTFSMYSFRHSAGIFFIFFFCISFLNKTSTQTPVIQFEKSLGGTQEEFFYNIEASGDTGYIAIGSTYSNDGDVHGNQGGWDMWMLHLNLGLDTIWTKCIGGSLSDWGFAIESIGSDGYVFSGYSTSDDGDILGNLGNYDAIAARLSRNGDTIDAMNTGGSENDMFGDFAVVSDGMFILAGISNSTDGYVYGNHGNDDIWMMKIGLHSDTLWTRCYGGSETDNLMKIVKTHDGSFLAGGITTSTDGDVHDNHGSADIFLMKVNDDGDTLWTKCYGGMGDEVLFDIRPTSDNGFIMAGYAGLVDGDVNANYGGADFWVLKLNSDGDTMWTKCLGGSENDIPRAVIETDDGGYLAGGYTFSDDGCVHGHHGEEDVWVVKLDAQGDTLWTRCFGGSNPDYLNDFQLTSDGGIILAAQTESDDGDVTENHGILDAWLVKLCYPSEITIDTTICFGSVYYAGGDYQSEAGTYYDVYENTNGCDSIITTILHVESCELGTRELTEELPVIFPNPTNGILYISIDDIDQIYVLDVTGKIILESNEKEIDLSSFPTGMYYVKVISTNNTQYLLKIIYTD